MKKLGCILCAVVIVASGLRAQAPVAGPQEPDTLVKPAAEEQTSNPVIDVQDKKDTVSLKIGHKGVNIVTEGDGTRVEFVPLKNENDSRRRWRRHRSFEGHWAGLEIGMNNYLTSDNAYPEDFLSLNTGKSWNVNLNFLQYDQRLIGNTVGLVTGLGLRFNDYKFSGNYTLGKDSTGAVVMVPYADPLKMSKLNVGYLTLPLIMEIHAGRSFYIAGGVIGSMKIRSYTKIKYYVDGKVNKNKVKQDYAISPLQYAATVRIGIRELNVYANYNLTPLFQKDKGPELYPFSVGLAIRFN